MIELLGYNYQLYIISHIVNKENYCIYINIFIYILSYLYQPYILLSYTILILIKVSLFIYVRSNY